MGDGKSALWISDRLVRLFQIAGRPPASSTSEKHVRQWTWTMGTAQMSLKMSPKMSFSGTM